MSFTAARNSPGILPYNNPPTLSRGAELRAEMALLGALMANNKAYERVKDFLAPEHFADPLHAEIYATIVRRIEAGERTDALTVREDFKIAGRLKEISGGNYLVDLLLEMTGIMNAAEQGQAIHGAWIGRDLLQELMPDALPRSPDAAAPEEQALSDLAVCQAHQVLAGGYDASRDVQSHAESLLLRMEHVLDEAHARADRLLARLD